MSLQPIAADNLQDLVRLINDRLRRVAPGGEPLESVGVPQKPDSPVPRHWVEANFVTKDAARDILVQEVRKVVNTSTVRSVRSHALILTVSGILAVSSAASAVIKLNQDFPASMVRALVKRPPVGDKIVCLIMAGDNEWGRVEIPDGSDEGEAVIASSLPAGSKITLDIVNVGSSFPGSDLTVEVM